MKDTVTIRVTRETLDRVSALARERGSTIHGTAESLLAEGLDAEAERRFSLALEPARSPGPLREMIWAAEERLGPSFLLEGLSRSGRRMRGTLGRRLGELDPEYRPWRPPEADRERTLREGLAILGAILDRVADAVRIGPVDASFEAVARLLGDAPPGAAHAVSLLLRRAADGDLREISDFADRVERAGEILLPRRTGLERGAHP